MPSTDFDTILFEVVKEPDFFKRMSTLLAAADFEVLKFHERTAIYEGSEVDAIKYDLALKIVKSGALSFL